MDIEGAENSVVESLLELPCASELPFQISVETHGEQAAARFNRQMATLGYVVVNKEQNMLWMPGWEWTWVRAYCDLNNRLLGENVHWY